MSVDVGVNRSAPYHRAVPRDLEGRCFGKGRLAASAEPVKTAANAATAITAVMHFARLVSLLICTPASRRVAILATYQPRQAGCLLLLLMGTGAAPHPCGQPAALTAGMTSVPNARMVSMDAKSANQR